MEGIAPEKHRDALITLNEMSTHQENKDIMISKDLVAISSKYLHDPTPEIRRESVLLLGSLLSIMRGREFVNPQTFSGIQYVINNITVKRT